jgi:23S rRNA pseudouridine2605 synthase
LTTRQGLSSGQRLYPHLFGYWEKRDSQTLLEVVLTEGRNRQIRRIAEQLGYPVIHLHRIAIGPIHLERKGKSMFPGTYRLLEDFEITFLKTKST